MRLHDCFSIYNILIDEEMQQNFNKVKICVMFKWQIFLIFSLRTVEILSHFEDKYAILWSACENYNIVLICHIYTHTHTPTHAHALFSDENIR